MDVTPRLPEERRDAIRAQRRRRNPLAMGLLAVLVVALGVVVYQGLTNATTYFYQADEAVARRPQLGTTRIRVLGTVDNDIDDATDGQLTFTISMNGATIPVVHHGDPEGLFKVGQPVVLEGRFDGDTFESDRMLIKHSETYVAQNPDRVASDAP
jgi:cytochrome c-type biogenesis protein CcmE